MPIEPLTLVALVDLVAAWVLDDASKRPDWPAGAGEGGVTDAALWDLMYAAGAEGDAGTRADPVDLLCGMRFDEAVCQDVRRIEALADARITLDFYGALAYLHTPNSPVQEMMKQAYCIRNAALRQMYGHVALAGILEARKQSWGYYGQVLEVALAMRRPGTEAEAFWQMTLAHQDQILGAFEEAVEIYQRAAMATPNEGDVGAWEEMAEITRNMKSTLGDKLLGLGAAVQAPARAALPAAGAVPAGAGAPPPAQIQQGMPAAPMEAREDEEVEIDQEPEGDEEEFGGSIFGSIDVSLDRALMGMRDGGADPVRLMRMGVRGA